MVNDGDDGEEMRRNRLRRRALAMVSALHPKLRDRAAVEQAQHYMDFAEQSESDAKHLVNHYYRVAMDALNTSGPAPFKLSKDAPMGSTFVPRYTEVEYHVDKVPATLPEHSGSVLQVKTMELGNELMPGEPMSHYIARMHPNSDIAKRQRGE